MADWTVTLDAVDRIDLLERQELHLTQALALIIEGLRTSDVSTIGTRATLTSQFQDRVLHKTRLSPVLEFARRVRAAAATVAHSGTVLTALFPDDRSVVEKAMREIRKCLPALHTIYHRRL